MYEARRTSKIHSFIWGYSDKDKGDFRTIIYWVSVCKFKIMVIL